MFRLLITVFCLFVFSMHSFAEEEVKPELPPLDPDYEAIHPMALVSKGSTIFAYYLSTYQKPHDLQLVYKLSVKDVPLVQLVRDSDLVTIKPKRFNIQRLMRGESTQLTADVYLGDYRRDGLLTYEAKVLEFDELLFVRKLNELQPSSKRRQYEMISYNSKSDRLFVHHLQEKPSFAHMLHIDLTAGCLSAFNTSSAVPKENEILYKFINCGTIKPMYYDTQGYE